MPLLRPLALSLAAVLLALSGCKGPCRQLSEELCKCSANSNAKTNCLQRASSQEQNAQPTPEDDQRCAALLPTCDCNHIDTAEGKQACGLAR